MLEQGFYILGERWVDTRKGYSYFFIARIKKNKGIQSEEHQTGFREQIGNNDFVKEVDLSFLIQTFITYM